MNPTGQMFSQATLERLADWAESKGIWIISDEVYRRFIRKTLRPVFAAVSLRVLLSVVIQIHLDDWISTGLGGCTCFVR